MVKPVRVYFIDENTYKTFGVGDESVGDLHKLMQEKMEKSDEEARKFGIVEKKPDGERFPDITEKVSSIVSQWEKEKKKGESQFWWKERPFENKTIRVYFLDGTYKAIVTNPDTTAAILHEAVASKIELSNDTNMGLFDQRKKGDRPLPSSENIFAIMEDWKRNSKKGDKEDENRFVFRLKSPMKDEDVVEDPVRVHLLYLEARSEMMSGTLVPTADEMVQLTALEVQINFGDYNPKVHTDGFLIPKLKELIPKKILSSKKDKEWEKEVFKQHSTHKGMRPLFAKLECLQTLHKSFRASASIVAINKAEQSKRDEEELAKKAKAAAVKASAAAAPVISAGGVPPPPPPPPAPKAAEPEDEDVNAFPSRAELTATTASARVSTRFDLLASIEDGINLKRVEINDRSAPKLESGVKIKKSDRNVLLKEIGEGAELKKTETVDKSAPKVDGVKIKKVDRKGLLDGIESDKKLKHVETEDKSAPKFVKKKVDREGMFSEIEKGNQLKHAETSDKSSPILDRNVKIKKIDRKGMLDGIEKGVKLKKSETKDASAPVISDGMKVEIGARANLLVSIEEGVLLKRVTDADKIPKGEGVIRKPKKNKAPKPPKAAAPGGIPPPPPKPPIAGGKVPPPPPPPPSSTSVSSHTAVMQSIEKGAKLKKAETVDKSGPKVEQVKIKKVDRKDLLKEIEGDSGDKKLKHTETVDKSAPTIEAVKVKKIDRKGMLESIEKGDKNLKHTETVDKSSPKISRKKVDPTSVLADIAKGETKLKHTETVDKSSPVVERVKVKKIDRSALLRGIESGIDLRVSEETRDSSAPVIEADTKLKKEERGRGGLLADIEKGTALKKVAS